MTTLNRRSFLKRAGGAALAVVAAPLFIPAERLEFGVPKPVMVPRVGWRTLNATYAEDSGLLVLGGEAQIDPFIYAQTMLKAQAISNAFDSAVLEGEVIERFTESSTVIWEGRNRVKVLRSAHLVDAYSSHEQGKPDVRLQQSRDGTHWEDLEVGQPMRGEFIRANLPGESIFAGCRVTVTSAGKE